MKSQDRLYATQTLRNVHFSTLEEVAVDPVLETVETAGFNLVLYNDEHNTFDHVIDMLVAICGHDVTQAEQCALLVHFKGKCTVLSGTYDELEPKCTKLLDADLTAEIEA
jgi:ATP-dependent Clp protease adaptor protein ClpS